MPFYVSAERTYFSSAPVISYNTKVSGDNDGRLPAGVPGQAINAPQQFGGYRVRSYEPSRSLQQTYGLRHCENSPDQPMFGNNVRVNGYNAESVNSTPVITNYSLPILRQLLVAPDTRDTGHFAAGFSDHAGQSRGHSSGMFMAVRQGGIPVQNYQGTPLFSNACRFAGVVDFNPSNTQKFDACSATLPSIPDSQIIPGNEDSVEICPEYDQYGAGHSDPSYDRPAVSISSVETPDVTTQKKLIKEFSEQQYMSLGFFLKVMANDGRYKEISYTDATSKTEVRINIDSHCKGSFSLLGFNLANLLCTEAENNHAHYIGWSQDKTHVHVTLKALENRLQQESGSNGFSLDMPSDDELWKHFFYHQHLSLWPFLKGMADFGHCPGISYTNKKEKKEVGVNLVAFDKKLLTPRLDIHLIHVLRAEAHDARFWCVWWSKYGNYIMVNLKGIESEVPRVVQ